MMSLVRVARSLWVGTSGSLFISSGYRILYVLDAHREDLLALALYMNGHLRKDVISVVVNVFAIFMRAVHLLGEVAVLFDKHHYNVQHRPTKVTRQ